MPNMVDHSGYFKNKHYNPRQKLESDLVLSLELSCVTIQMPHSRITRSRYSSSPPSRSWPRSIAKTYNDNAVGAFAGNFDKPMTSNIRCGNTVLNFQEFVDFRHKPEDECHCYKVDLEKYFDLSDISKIESLKIADDDIHELNIAGPASIKGKTRGELDTIIYTCVKHKCILPCPCYLCIDDDPDECEHKILHPGFFDPKVHLFTVRNADSYDINWNEENLTDGNKFCTNRKCRGNVVTHCPPQRSFRYRMSCQVKDKSNCCCLDCPYCKSLDVLKYPGTEKECQSCQMKLIHHESYHLVYHYMCLFCIESLTKFKNIMSEKEYWEQLDETRYEETISCKFCHRLFFDKQKKERHIEIVHNKNPDYLYACDDCSKAFGSKQALKYHIESVHEKLNLEIPCDVCEKTFRMNQNLDDHMRQVHGDLKYDCELCPAEFKRQSNLNHHYEIVHDTLINKLYLHDNPGIIEYFECEQCDHKTREKRTLAHHVKYVHLKDEQPVLYCDLCDFKTIENKTLKRHQRTVHSKSNIMFECELCNYKTSRKDNFAQHTQYLHSKGEEEKKYNCELCDFASKYKANLNRHKKIHEKRAGNFWCDKCDYRSDKKKLLQIHKKFAHKKKVFKCQKCEFRTLDENIFAVHDASRHLECNECQFKCTLPLVLNAHKRTIHGPNPRKRKSTTKVFDE